MAVLEEVSKTSVQDLKDVEKVLMKINVTNLPTIVEKLDMLGIQLTDFITNPGIFFEFLGDPENQQFKRFFLGNVIGVSKEKKNSRFHFLI